MKLLLDEHLSPAVARQLRERGHDVIAVAEQAGLRGRADRVHIATAPDQQRVIVTRDPGDYRPLLAQTLRTGAKTYGLICVPRRFPLNERGVGRLVRALEALLGAYPGVEDVVKAGGEVWLQEP